MLAHKGGRESLEKAILRYGRALELEPGFAEAAAAIADAYSVLGRAGGKPVEVFPKAMEAARNALALTETSAEAHTALANALFWYERNWPEAEKHFRRAIEINPSSAAAHHDYAWYQVAAGRTEDGLNSLRLALELDPLSRRVNVDAGWLLMQARRFREAGEQAKRALELDPGLPEAIACLGRSYIYQKKWKEARDELLRVLPESPLRAEVAAMAPEPALRRLHQAWLEQTKSMFEKARIAAWLGEKEKALDVLEQAFKEHSGIVPLLKTEPAFDGLRSEARFQELVRKAGIP
jgi:tetratricopeptide (TPR) repeat protein